MSDPNLLVLASLANGEKHGYAMMLDIESFAGVRLGPGNAVRGHHAAGGTRLYSPHAYEGSPSTIRNHAGGT